MRNSKLKTMMLLSMLGIATIAMGQNRGYMNRAGQGAGCPKGHHQSMHFIPDLTADQQASIKEIKTEGMKNSSENRLKIQENRLEYKRLVTSAIPDQKAIDKNIEEFASLRLALMKEKTRTILKIRALLTEEQQVYFDERIIRGKRHGRHHGMGARGNCPYGSGPGAE